MGVKKTMLAVAALVISIAVVPAAGARVDGDSPSPSATGKAQTTKIQILGLNDFHGQLEVVPAASSSGGRIGRSTGSGATFSCVLPACTPAGGVEYLATHVANLRSTNPNTLFVSAGDLIGATPLLSALFHDEPTIEAFNLMGLDYNGVGNHEFDEGVDELLRMQNGGCHPVDGCADGTPFNGAEFDFLAANVTYKSSGAPIFAPYAIHEFDGVKVGLIGMTTKTTPTIVTPAGIATVDFLDEAASANAAVAELKKQNVETIIVLLHEGGNSALSGNGAGAAPAQEAVNSCQLAANPGPIPSIVEAMDDEIDVVVTGHTNWAVNCRIDGKVVTGAASQGRLITDIDLEVSRATKDVAGEIRVNNQIVTQDVPKAPALTALIARYNVFAGPIGARVIGSTTGPISRDQNAAGESALGDVIADAQLANTVPAGGQFAFMNPGGIRASIGTTGALTYKDAFAVQPFSNIVVTLTLTGAQVEQVLEQQWCGANGGSGGIKMLQVSNGFTYTYDGTGIVTGGDGSRTNTTLDCDRIALADIKLNDVSLGAETEYGVTVNSFLATGGDGFTVINEGTNRVFGDDDLVALEKYFATNSPVAPGPQNRITRVP
jgi:5'-nucleotidase